MTKTWTSKYFCGVEIPVYEIQRGYISYQTLAQAFDAVMVNDIDKLFYAEINGEYNEPEPINGYIDNSEQTEELRGQIDELLDEYNETDDSERAKEILTQIDELQEQIDELQQEQDEQPEIYQYFIISSYGADILQDFTDEIVYYLPALDCYVWGVTHYGTPWGAVNTNIAINIEE